MAESHLPYAEADDYLFGRLTPAAHRRFEERLARDAALARHVRELEEGVLALALSAPQLPAPQDAWIKIQATIAPEREKKSPIPAFRLDWLWSGWGFAAALAVALIVCLAWFQALGPGKNDRAPALAETPTDKTAPFSPISESKFVSNGATNDVGPATVVKNNAVEVASHSHQSLQIRRAQSPVVAPRMKLASIDLLTSSTTVVQTMTTQGGGQVDFVDLANPDMATSPVLSTVIAMIQPQDLRGGIYMFAVNTNLFISVDPATLPANSGPLTVLALDANDNPFILGSFSLGANPTLINLGDTNLGVSAGIILLSGTTNIIGYFPP